MVTKVKQAAKPIAKQAAVAKGDVRQYTNRKSLVHPLAFLANDFREQIRLGLKQRKHPLRTAHAKILVHLDIEGTRLTDLAERASISKQAMGKIIDELEKLGYISRNSHTDGRAKVIQFTRNGLKLLKDSGDIVDDVWQGYATVFGEKRLAGFRNELNDLYSKVKHQRFKG